MADSRHRYWIFWQIYHISWIKGTFSNIKRICSDIGIFKENYHSKPFMFCWRIEVIHYLNAAFIIFLSWADFLQIKFFNQSLTRVMQKIVVYYVLSKVNIFCFASSARKDMYLVWGKKKLSLEIWFSEKWTRRIPLMGWTTKNPRTLSPFLDCKGLASLSQRHLVYNTLSLDQKKPWPRSPRSSPPTPTPLQGWFRPWRIPNEESERKRDRVERSGDSCEETE